MPIDDNKMIAIVITDKGHVENRNVVIDGNVSKAEVKQTIDIISKLIVGVPIDEVSQVLEFELNRLLTVMLKSMKLYIMHFIMRLVIFRLSRILE